MSEMSADGIFLTTKEFTLLLLLKGLKKLYGFQIPGMSEFRQEDGTKALFSLVKKGFLSQKDDGLTASEPLGEILRGICGAGYVVYAKRQQPSFGELCLYVKNLAADAPAFSVEMVGSGDSLIKVSIWNRQMDCLEEKGFLLEEICSDELLYKKEPRAADADLKPDEWQTRLTFTDAGTGKEKGSISLYKRPVDDLIVQEMAGEEVCFYAYSRRKLAELLSEKEEKKEI